MKKTLFLCAVIAATALPNRGVLTAAPETAPLSHNGDIYFSTQTGERPPEGRHLVAPGQEITVCLKLRSDLPLFQKLEQGAIGYRLILEDQEVPPHILTIAPGNRLKLMKRDAEGCFSGSYRLPATVPSGLFQVADLLLAYEDQSYYSLRDYLYGFSQVDELEVNNPQTDHSPPRLVKISNLPVSSKKVRVSRVQTRIGFGQIFIFADEGTGIDAASLKVRYRIALDGQVKGYTLAKCRFSQPHDRFTCKVQLVRPVEEWGVRTVRIDLDGITLADKAGNKLVSNDPAEWEAPATGALISFEFPPQFPRTLPQRDELKNDTLF
jgi:hypothetical protein